MLHRSTSAPVWSPARWVNQRRGLLTGPTSNLLRYVMLAAILTAIGCAYLWQVNSLSDHLRQNAGPPARGVPAGS